MPRNGIRGDDPREGTRGKAPSRWKMIRVGRDATECAGCRAGRVFANARGGEWRRRERGRGAAGSMTGTSREGPVAERGVGAQRASEMPDRRNRGARLAAVKKSPRPPPRGIVRPPGLRGILGRAPWSRPAIRLGSRFGRDVEHVG